MLVKINQQPYMELAGSISETKESITTIGEFITDMRSEGIWYAFTGEHFKEWFLTTIKDLFQWLLDSILFYNDVFFLAPAILFMLMTFFVGKNRTTKFIIPSWFAYFVTEMIHKSIGS